MPTYWHKRDWWPSDMDRTNPHMPAIMPGALPPGIYCEDEDAFRALQRGSGTRGRPMDPAFAGAPARLDGQAVYVATPAQAELLRAIASKEPPPPAPDPVEDLAPLMELAKRMEKATRTDIVRPSRPAPPPVRHPFRGANRAQRRAAEAKGRKRA